MEINSLANGSIKIQTNLNLATEKEAKIDQQSPGQTFADHLLEAVQSTATNGHTVENLSATSNDAAELAMAMDQFLIELSALKALVDETRRAIDRIFQEARA